MTVMLPEKFVVYGAVHTSEKFPLALSVDLAVNVSPEAVTLEIAALAKEPTPIIPQPLAVVRDTTAVVDEALLTILLPSITKLAEQPLDGAPFPAPVWAT